MPRDVVVRETAESDLPAITAIYRHAVSEVAASFELQAPDVGETRRRWRMRVDKGYPHIVATRGGVVIGYASARRYRTGPAFRFLVEDSVYVASDSRGAGVGRTLLTELIKQCDALGFRKMMALIARENEPSVSLHQHLRFQPVGVIEGFAFKHDRWIDALLVQLALGDGVSSPPQGRERTS